MLETVNAEVRTKEIRGTTRRRVLAGSVAAASAMALGLDALGATGQAAAPADAGTKTRTSLHQEVELKAVALRIYDALLDSKQFTAFSHEPAEIHGEAGGAFVMFGNRIEGRNVELVPGQRIVQAWRPTHWDAGVYSIVRFEFKEQGGVTGVVLDHTGFPEGRFDSLDAGWAEHYWTRLMQYFA